MLGDPPADLVPANGVEQPGAVGSVEVDDRLLVGGVKVPPQRTLKIAPGTSVTFGAVRGVFVRQNPPTCPDAGGPLG